MVLSRTIDPLRNPVLALAVAACLVGLSSQAAGAAWRFEPLAQQFPKENTFTRTYDQRTAALATAVNDYGHQFGVFRLPENRIRSYSVVFADNPDATTVSRDDFIPLAGGEPTCWWFFCSEQPFGIQLYEDQAYSAWFNTALGTSPLPGSLPFSRFPGNFVAENRAGVVASTQVSPEGQFSAVLTESGQPRVELTDIPWVVALSQGSEPLVLGYRGETGDCLVYGEGCEPPPCESEDGDRHQHQRGRGHREHGRGFGYGHDRDGCRKDDSEQTTAIKTDDTAAGGPVLIRVRSNNTTQRWQFPNHLGRDHGHAGLRAIFPLTMNDQRVVLRATVEGRDRDWRNRMVQCRLGDVIDNNADGTVDCVDGLEPLLPLDEARPVGTVLGFSLNAAGLLVGNQGFSAAGVGTPFVVDTTAAEPRARVLHNRASGHEGWELNTVTDLNAGGMAVGYGYRDCSAQPDAFTLYPAADSDAAALTFAHRQQPENSAVAPGQRFDPEIVVNGGSGNYLYQMASKRPGDSQWQTEHGWQGQPGSYQASPDYQGDVCLRIRVQDSADATRSAARVVRVRVSENPEAGAREQDLVGDRNSTDALDRIRIGPFAPLGLILIVLSGTLRRRYGH